MRVLALSPLALTVALLTSLGGACTGGGAARSTAASAPALSGKYVATTTGGPGFLSITFLDGASYTLQPGGCVEASCAESGTYAESGGSLVLTDGATGAKTTYAFGVSQTAPTAESSVALHLEGNGLGGGDAGGEGALDGGAPSLGGGDAASLVSSTDGGTTLVTPGGPLTVMAVTLNGQGFSKWKVGLYTGSSYYTLSTEQTALTAAGAVGHLSLYLNYADFSEFTSGPDPNDKICDVDTLTSDGVQLVMAFQPTNAPFCTHASITATGNNGCRLADLTSTAPHASTLAGYYASIATYADMLSQPLIFRFGSEMNANWDDWDYGYDETNNSPANFVSAWEFAHHEIVTHLHTGKVLFAYAPNNVSYDGSNFAADIQHFWPGSANVDLIGLDGYTTSGHTFSSDFGTQLTQLEALGSAQDVMLAEFAGSTTTAAHGGGSLVNRETWLDGAVQVLAKHPRLHYMNWFDNDLSHTYQLSDKDSTGQPLYARFAADLLGGTTGGE